MYMFNVHYVRYFIVTQSAVGNLWQNMCWLALNLLDCNRKHTKFVDFVWNSKEKRTELILSYSKTFDFNDVSRQKELTFLHVWNVQRIALFSSSLVCEFHRIRLSLLSVAVVVCRWTHLPQVFGLWCDLFVTMAAHRCFERLENLPVTWAPSEHHSFAYICFMLRTFELNVKNCIWFHSKRCKFEQEAIANVSMILRHSIKFH